MCTYLKTYGVCALHFCALENPGKGGWLVTMSRVTTSGHAYQLRTVGCHGELRLACRLAHNLHRGMRWETHYAVKWGRGCCVLRQYCCISTSAGKIPVEMLDVWYHKTWDLRFTKGFQLTVFFVHRNHCNSTEPLYDWSNGSSPSWRICISPPFHDICCPPEEMFGAPINWDAKMICISINEASPCKLLHQ